MSSFSDQLLPEYDIPIGEVTLHQDQILRAMGYDPTSPANIPGLLRDVLEHLMHSAKDHVAIRGGFRILDPEAVQIGKSSVSIRNVRFESGRIINAQLRKAESIALFVCTLGQPFDEWVAAIKRDDDMLMTYAVDTLGSELIEGAVDWLEQAILKQIMPRGWFHSNRFSPGYCTWPLMDQHTLFSFFPANYCGISLHPSALMTPIKSVSGIYGLGSRIRKRDYQCSICTAENCYKRLY